MIADRRSQIAIRSAIVCDHMETTSAILRSRSQTIAEDRTMFYLKAGFHMIADDRRLYCDLRSAIIWKPAFISIRSTCTIWPNYPVTEHVETAFKLRQRMKKALSCAHVLHKTLNLVISRCCLAEYGEEMFQNL